MKKYLAIIVGMLLVLAMTSVVYAETKLTMYGDARTRGTWKSDYDFNEDVDADDRWWDYRIRLGIKAVADGGTTVDMRLSVTDWNKVWGDGIGTGTSGPAHEKTTGLDYGYINVPLGKGVDLTLGKVIVSWGKGFMAWDNRAYRAIIGTKFGDTIVKAFTQKSVETRAASGDYNLEDRDAYSALFVHKTKNLEFGGIYVYDTNDAGAADADGHILDGYFHGKWGAVQAFGELSYKGGDLFENAAGDDQLGGFLHVDYKTGPVTLIGAVAFTKDGYESDDDFTPTFFYGTSQSTGIMNFGAGGDTLAGLLAVSYAATKDLTLMGKIALATIDTAAGDVDLMEIDLGLSYKINKSTTYAIDFGYLSPDKISYIVPGAKDDAAVALTHRIVVNF